MRIDWWTLAFQTVNVLVLVWLLRRFLFRPVMAIVARRQDETRQMMAAAADAKREAAQVQAKAADEARQLAAHRSELLQAAEAEAGSRKSALLDEAHREIGRLKASAEAERERVRHEEERLAMERAALLATDIAAKLVGRLPDEVRVAPFLPGLAAGVASLPQADRASLTEQAGAGALPLAAPRDLVGTERAGIEEALGKLLGVPVSLAVEVSPDILAGLEIRGEQAVVRNSLRADLDAITAELTRHER